MTDAESSPDVVVRPTQGQPTLPHPNPRFTRRWRGYDPQAVDAYVDDLRAWATALAGTIDQWQAADQARADELAEARSQVRYWRDRETFIEEGLAELRRRTQQVEHDIAERTRSGEKAVQVRIGEMLDWARDEARRILASANAAASDLRERQNSALTAERARIEQLVVLQDRVATGMRDSLRHFEHGLLSLDSSSPARVSLDLQGEVTPPPVSLPPASSEPMQRISPSPGYPGDAPAPAPVDEPISLHDEHPPHHLHVIDGGGSDSQPTLHIDHHAVHEPDIAADDGVEPEHELDQPQAVTPPAAAIRQHIAPRSPARQPEVRERATLKIGDDAVVSPSSVSVELYPIEDFSTLTNFERALGELDGVNDIYVARFDKGVAELQVQLERPLPLAEMIRQGVGMELEVDDRRPDRLMTRLQLHGSSTA